MGKRIILTKEQENKIIYNYTVLKYGQKRSGAFIPVSADVVKKVLIKHGIPIKTMRETNISKYGLNHNYFQEQTHDMGYWLGILGSDGCVASKENQIYIELQRQDRELLEKLNASIQNGRPVKDYETGRGYENSKIYFYSSQIKKDLATYKIIPNKTYDRRYGFPDKLNEKYYPDYIRGLFDGDGSVKLTGKTITWQVDTGSLEIAENIIDFFKEYNIEASITILPKKDMDLYRVYLYGKNKCSQVYKLLYSTPSNLFLARKKEKLEFLIKLS